MGPKEFLQAAREYLSDPAKWCQGTAFRDVNGAEVQDKSEAASCCLIGVLSKVGQKVQVETHAAAFSRLADVVQKRGYAFISRYNDAPGRTHAEILSVLDEAIGAAS